MVLETSDCLLAIGYRPLGVTTGDFSASLPANTIHARGHSVDVGDDNYQAVTLKEVLKGVIDAIPRVTSRAPRSVAPSGVLAGLREALALEWQTAGGRAVAFGIPSLEAALGGGLAIGALHEIAAASEAEIPAATGFALILAGRNPGPV